MSSRGDVVVQILAVDLFPDSVRHSRSLLFRERGEVLKETVGILKEINGKNLHDNIAPTRQRASLVMHKSADHRIREVHLRKL